MLRTQLPHGLETLLASDRDRVRLDLSLIDLDHTDQAVGAVFLEGFDMPGEEGFEEWLREQRQLARSAEPDAPLARLSPALPRSVVDLAAPTPGFGGKPAIAVLPFVNTTSEPDGEMWAEGISEDLIERLSRLRWLPVISPASLGDLRGDDLDAARIGQMVGAAYVLRGRLAQRAGTPALQVTLLDGLKGQLLWSERFSLPAGVTQEVLEQLAHQLVANLESRIDTEQQVRVIDRAVEDLSYNELVWRARWHLNQLTRADSAIARDLLERAVQERPNSAEVLIQLTLAMAWDVWTQRLGPEKIIEFRTTAYRAVAADSFDGRGYMLAGMAELWLRNHDQAEELLKQALQQNPSLASAYAQLGTTYGLSDRPAEAFEPFRIALRLSPLDFQVSTILGEIAVSHLQLGDHEETVRHADLSLIRRPAYFYAHVSKINGLVRGGKINAAKQALQALYRAKPSFQPDFVDWLPFRDSKWNAYLKEGVAMAENG
ncbi:MAG: hypothetical protein ACKOPE_09235 [Novosphingobium sp.]